MALNHLDKAFDANSAIHDAFGRLRVGNPYTIFDSKQIVDKDPLRWDDQETSGSGTSSGAEIAAQLENALYLGATIDGTVDEIVLCIRPLSANADIQASITWREVV